MASKKRRKHIYYCSRTALFWMRHECNETMINIIIIVAIFYNFSQFCGIGISSLSLQKQPKTAPNIFQRGVKYDEIARQGWRVSWVYVTNARVARKLTASREMPLWMTPSEAPKALQASECSELLDPMRASCWISAQHQQGKGQMRG